MGQFDSVSLGISWILRSCVRKAAANDGSGRFGCKNLLIIFNLITKVGSLAGKGSYYLIAMTPEDCMCLVKERQLEKEVDENGGLGPAHDGDEGERVDGSNHLFLREVPILTEESRISKDYNCQDKKVGAREELVLRKDMCKQGTKLSRRDRVELGCQFQRAVSSCDWELAWNLLVLAKAQALNDVLCVALDSVWFLTTHEELDGITGLIKKIIGDGANDFTRAILRTSFLASCVSACQSKMMNLTDAVGVTTQR